MLLLKHLLSGHTLELAKLSAERSNVVTEIPWRFSCPDLVKVRGRQRSVEKNCIELEK